MDEGWTKNVLDGNGQLWSIVLTDNYGPSAESEVNEDLKQVKLRLSGDLREFIQAEATRNQSSMGSEIARAVRERKERVERERRSA